MKEETRIRKMMEALGLSHKLEEHLEVKKNLNKPIAVDESEIQSFRASQGIIYFLQAPELFTLKVCKHCEAEFLVSRKFVALCSFTCIKASLAEIGIDWTKDEDIEALVKSDVYEGNEPIWIRNIDRLREVLHDITEAAVGH